MEAQELLPVNIAEPRLSLSNILMATDLSEASDRALEYALAVARRYDSHLYLAHVLTPDGYQYAPTVYPIVRQSAEEGIANILVSGRLRGIPHEVLIEEGYLWPTLERLIRKLQIDLAVVGTHGRTGVDRLILGSSAELIFRHADCPVLTVGPAAQGEVPREAKPQNILLPTNFGRAAEHALPYALSLAQEFAAKLTLLHVIEDSAGYSESGLATLQDTTLLRLEQYLPPGALRHCTPECTVGFGDPANEILELARERKADLIVMGAKRGSRLTGHLPLSTAYTVAASAASPVMTVKG